MRRQRVRTVIALACFLAAGVVVYLNTREPTDRVPSRANETQEGGAEGDAPPAAGVLRPDKDF